MAMRMLVETMMRHYAAIPAPGVDEVRWKKPVRPGDTLFLRAEIRELIPSRSKIDRGIVRSLVTLTNQKGEVILTLTPINLYRRRSAQA
jgi:acyl dehydratase